MDEALTTIREQILCTDYLQPSKTYSEQRQTGYCCPICGSGRKNNETGALQYYPKSNTWHCHSCGKSGDVIDLIRESESCDFKTAVAIGKSILGIYDPTEQPQTDFKPQRHKSQGRNAEPRKIENTAPRRDITMTPEYKTQRDQSIKWYAEKNGYQFVAMYDYCYGNYQDGLTKVRFQDKNGEKQFAWVYCDPVSKYGCKWGKNGNRLFVVGDPDDYIFFMTEGEKDAITAHDLYPDVTAVSAMDGATKGETLGNKWKPEYSEQIQDRDVYIFTDNDEAGANFARLEAMEASKTARKVYLLDIKTIWKDCPEHGDITDMVEALGKDKAKELIDAYIAIVKPFGEPEQEKDYLSDFLDKVQTHTFEPYKTELPFFDKLLGGGVMPQSLILLMASPATGKTTLCQQIAETMAKHRKPIVYLNLEMSREQMLAKSIATRIRQKHPESYINVNTVLRGYDWDDTQKRQIPAEVEAYRQEIFPYLKYNPEDTGHRLSDIAKLLERLGESAKATGTQAPAVVLDYLHLVSPDRNVETAEHIKQVVMTLKNYAIKYNTFVIGIVAINRQSDGQITLDSGRDSSNIEYTADVVLSLEYKDIDNRTVRKGEDNYNERLAELQQANPREMIIRVLKSRFGEVGRSEIVYFNANAGYFYRADNESNRPHQNIVRI